MAQIILMMHKDVEEMEVLCQSAVRDGGFRQMFTEGNATRKGSGLLSSSVCMLRAALLAKRTMRLGYEAAL